MDGTISESDFKGHVFPYFGFTADHDYVVELFHKIAENGYKMVYLTARSIAQDKDTRGYLFEVSTYILHLVVDRLKQNSVFRFWLPLMSIWV